MRLVEEAVDRRVERLADRLEIGPQLRLLVGRDRRVVERRAPVGRALEDGQRRDLVGDDRDHLDAARSGADHGDALAREVDGRCRPPARVVRLAAEVLAPGHVWVERHREHAGGGDQESSVVLGAVGGDHGPRRRGVVPGGGGDLDAEPHVATEVEPVDHVVEVALGLGLLGEVLLPHPLVEEVLREQVGVGVALRVEPGPGVPVPIPGAPHAVARLEQRRREPLLERAVQLVDAGDAGADDQLLDVRLGLRGDRHCTDRLV